MNLTPAEVLAKVPQQEPFRFIDEIEHLDVTSIIANYTFKSDSDFYKGHFPGTPITPGVLLLEASAQAGVVAYGIYLASLELEESKINNILTLFTDAEIEFSGIVKPGDKIIVKAKKEYFRRLKLKVSFETSLVSGKVVCSGKLSGLGVNKDGK